MSNSAASKSTVSSPAASTSPASAPDASLMTAEPASKKSEKPTGLNYQLSVESKETHQLSFITSENLVIPTLKILQDDGSEYTDAAAINLNKETALHCYKTMQYIRVLDERMVAAQRQ
ncbi:MAG TPA: hypothetical protein DCE61_03805, partial [Cellvibrionales bacterium]|nr:hypothetical protein [Cellvibrionales bacterium]